MSRAVARRRPRRNTLPMRTTAVLAASAFALVIAASQAGSDRLAAARADGVAIDADDICGGVTHGEGPVAGGWGVDASTDLPTKFARIVVTDDRGRYLI